MTSDPIYRALGKLASRQNQFESLSQSKWNKQALVSGLSQKANAESQSLKLNAVRGNSYNDYTFSIVQSFDLSRPRTSLFSFVAYLSTQHLEWVNVP